MVRWQVWVSRGNSFRQARLRETWGKITSKVIWLKPFSSETYPYTVKDISIREDSYIQIRLDNLFHEEWVGQLNLGPFCHDRVFDFPNHITKCKMIVIPLLSSIFTSSIFSKLRPNRFTKTFIEQTESDSFKAIHKLRI
jgi:hypothetical protein